jgi:hypothetical protein
MKSEWEHCSLGMNPAPLVAISHTFSKSAMAEVGASRDGHKRRKVMNAEVFETPDPEVTFRPYAAANAAARGASRPSGDDTHFLDKVRSLVLQSSVAFLPDLLSPVARSQGNVQLDEDAVAPAQAFEVFMGKVYSTSFALLLAPPLSTR